MHSQDAQKISVLMINRYNNMKITPELFKECQQASQVFHAFCEGSVEKAKALLKDIIPKWEKELPVFFLGVHTTEECISHDKAYLPVSKPLSL